MSERTAPADWYVCTLIGDRPAGLAHYQGEAIGQLFGDLAAIRSIAMGGKEPIALVFDGNGDGVVQIDMGAIEALPGVTWYLMR